MGAESKFVLMEQQVEQFYQEGFFYAPGFISINSVDALNKEHESFSNEKNNGEWKSNSFSNFAKQGTQLPETAKFLTSPHVIDTLEKILGGSVRLWLGMYAVVPAGGTGLAWHQDNMYTHILGHMLNCFIALDPISEENAGLWISPRSHRLGRQPNLNQENGHKRAADPENGIPCKAMAPGDAVFFHRETLHHSKQNGTDKPRRAFAFQVASANCRYAETGKLLEDREILVAK